MLSDPLTLKSLSIVANTAITVLETNSFVTIDAGAGKSIRRCNGFTAAALGFATPGLLTIGHSVSSENKPAVTNRHAVRLDLTFKDKDGKPLKGFAFAVVGMPEGCVDDGEVAIPDATIGSVLMTNLIGALAVNPASAALSNTRLAAIIGGEP